MPLTQAHIHAAIAHLPAAGRLSRQQRNGEIDHAFRRRNAFHHGGDCPLQTDADAAADRHIRRYRVRQQALRLLASGLRLFTLQLQHLTELLRVGRAAEAPVAQGVAHIVERQLKGEGNLLAPGGAALQLDLVVAAGQTQPKSPVNALQPRCRAAIH